MPAVRWSSSSTLRLFLAVDSNQSQPYPILHNWTTATSLHLRAKTTTSDALSYRDRRNARHKTLEHVYSCRLCCPFLLTLTQRAYAFGHAQCNSVSSCVIGCFDTNSVGVNVKCTRHRRASTTAIASHVCVRCGAGYFVPYAKRTFTVVYPSLYIYAGLSSLFIRIYWRFHPATFSEMFTGGHAPITRP